MFDKTELKTQGMISATVRHPLTQNEFQLDFYVTDRKDLVLGIDACQRLASRKTYVRCKKRRSRRLRRLQRPRHDQRRYRDHGSNVVDHVVARQLDARSTTTVSTTGECHRRLRT